nr:hypothetical protein [uncultured bacterium]
MTPVSLPTIADYPLPAAAELPGNRVVWRPEPHRSVLLVHDMQHYFTDRFAGTLLDAVVTRIARLRRLAHDLGIPVIYTAQPGAQSAAARGLLADFWGAGLPADPAAAAIIAPLAALPGEHVVTKHRYSAFVGTNLDLLLGRRDQMIITGVYAHIGVLATACDAFMRGVEPHLVADAVGDFSAADHRQALDWAARRCARVTTTDQVLGALTGTGR